MPILVVERIPERTVLDGCVDRDEASFALGSVVEGAQHGIGYVFLAGFVEVGEVCGDVGAGEDYGDGEVLACDGGRELLIAGEEG